MADDKETPKLSPEEGMDKVQDLIMSLAGKGAENSLAGMDDILTALGQVVEDTGVDLPGIDEKLAAMRSTTSSTQAYIENLDAAMWVGDLDRARALNESGPPETDLTAFAGATLDLDGIDWDEEEEEDDEDFEFEFDFTNDDLFDDLPAIPEAPAQILPDLYADIAQGASGAIDAFIASGEDPNTPRGEAQHTALLAALDAPNRRADEIAKLIAAGADPKVLHYGGDNALSWAAGYHHPETVTAETEIELWTLLASHGVDPNHWTDVQNWSVLHRAIIQGDGNRVAAALAAGADASPPIPLRFLPEKLAGLTALMVAAPKPDVVTRLLAHGADPAKPDAQGRTPLAFFRAEAAAARARVTPEDPWTVSHAEALDRSTTLLEQALATA